MLISDTPERRLSTVRQYRTLVPAASENMLRPSRPAGADTANFDLGENMAAIIGLVKAAGPTINGVIAISKVVARLYVYKDHFARGC
jgi:hypothetical protein